MHNLLVEFIQKYPGTPDKTAYLEETLRKWNNMPGCEKSSRILTRTQYFLDSAKNPKQENLFAYFKGNLPQELFYRFQGTLREVSQKFLKKNLVELDVLSKTFSYANLDTNPICIDTSPQEVIDQIPNLNPGMYLVGASSPFAHALGLVIDEKDKNAYFYDPNLAIGKFNKENIQSVVKKAFKLYTSENLTDFNQPLSNQINSGFWLLQIKPTPSN